MKIAIPKERQSGEQRVAASPDTVKKLIDLGFDVTVEKGAGLGSAISDDDFKTAGAKIATAAKTALKDADMVLTINGLDPDGKGASGSRKARS